ncbi:uncharacterized protein JCM6883_005165 [Sporobolomyces salmoneus]|uniref:uncharacterized protein n=1 Tax=Sporobolomyces salmoneus TaxID=183962 RepID=UPI00317233B6
MPQLTLSSYISAIDSAIKTKNGAALAKLFPLFSRSPSSSSTLLLEFLEQQSSKTGFQRSDRILGPPGTTPNYAGQFSRTLKQDWAEIATCHVHALVALNPLIEHSTNEPVVPTEPIFAFEKQHELVNTLYRHLINSKDANTGWCLELLYRVCEDLRTVAQLADARLVEQQQKPGKLEEASRLLQKCFSCCLNDRSGEWSTSRKMGTYYLATLLFKTYFKLNSTALCKNIIRGIHAAELPTLDKYPRAHQTGYNYYMGVFAFLREDYKDAEARFIDCLEGIHRKASRNISLILDYLIPLLLLRGVIPSQKLLRLSSTHRTLYSPFVTAIKRGDVRSYDLQLERVEKRLMERGSWLVVERARTACIRGLLKKTWILEGKPSRVSIETFRKYYNAALHAGLAQDDPARNIQYDSEEMECLLANYINKGLIKGYISHAHQLVVLSKEKPFPWFPAYRTLTPTAQRSRDEKELQERNKESNIPPLPTAS